MYSYVFDCPSPSGSPVGSVPTVRRKCSLSQASGRPFLSVSSDGASVSTIANFTASAMTVLPALPIVMMRTEPDVPAANGHSPILPHLPDDFVMST